MKLLAGRVGQLMDYTSLANDVGVSAKTIKHWLSILEIKWCRHQDLNSGPTDYKIDARGIHSYPYIFI